MHWVLLVYLTVALLYWLWSAYAMIRTARGVAASAARARHSS